MKIQHIILEGGNLEVKGKEAQQINLKVANRNFMVPLLNKLLYAIDAEYKKQFKTFLWGPEVLKSREFLSGSSLHFFDVTGIKDEVFVEKKPKVGDIDTMVDKTKEPQLSQFLTAHENKKIGPATFIGFQRGNEQFSSLWEFSDPPIKIQIDFEFVEYVDNKPTEWAKFSHSSSWEDMQQGIKGVFHKLLIQSLAALSKKDFLLRKLVGRGKLRKEEDIPTTDNMYSFAVSSKEGGGVRVKYEPVLDDNGRPIVINNLPVMKATPTAGYQRDLNKIITSLLNKKLNATQLKKIYPHFWSFLGIIRIMNSLLSPEEKAKIAQTFLDKTIGKGAQGLYKNEPDRDMAEKTIAINKLFKELGINTPANLEQMKQNYKQSYRMTSALSEAAPNFKRQGIQHIYNPGSSAEMKDKDFIEMCKEIAQNGGTLDGMGVNFKADGAGIRFGKDELGRPFFMTSKVTNPLYKENIGDFEAFGRKNQQPPEQLERTKNYDKAMSLIINSDFIKSLPNNTIVQAEMMFNPMAEKTPEGLKFVNIPYDPKKLGKEMTLVPFMVKEYSTGQELPNEQELIKKLAAQSSSNIKILSNRLQQKGIDLSKFIAPVLSLNVDQLKTPEAKEILTKARKNISDAIINSPNLKGKDQLGKIIEGIVINLPSGRLAKVTSQYMKDVMAKKKTTPAPKREGPEKTAVVAIGSFVGHKGHQELWNYTLQKAAELKADPYLFIGPAVGKNDPIPPEVKVQTWHKLYPKYKNNISTVTVDGGSLLQKIKHELINPMPGKPPKYDNIVIMVGEDQKDLPMPKALMKAVNKFPGYEHVTVALGVTPRGTGISFTKLRNALQDKKLSPKQKYKIWADSFDEEKLGKNWILNLMKKSEKGMSMTQEQLKEFILRVKPLLKEASTKQKIKIYKLLKEPK